MAVFLFPIILTLIFASNVNNDIWFQLAEGKYIAKDGFFAVDPLTMHEGLNMTVQIPFYALITHYVYSLFGMLGIYVAMLLVVFLITLLIYRFCMLLSDKNVNVSLLITLITSSMMSFYGLFVTRPQMFSYVFFISTLYILEFYIKTKNKKCLFFLPIISLLQINFHASLWWLLIIVMAVYLVDGFKNKKLHLEGYEKKPLVIALIGMAIAGFINPYGYKAILYLLNSFNAFPIKEIVGEMMPLPLLSDQGLIVWGFVFGIILIYIFGNRQRIRMRHLMLFFGFLALGIDAQRGLAQFFLVMITPLALMFKDASFEKFGSAKMRRAISIWSGILVLYLIFVIGFVKLPTAGEPKSQFLRQAFQVIDDDVAASGKDRSQIKIYTGYGDGAYFEFKGYKPYIDPRAEVFLKKNNGKEDILLEWYEMTRGYTKIKDFLDKYDFDYLLVRNDSAILTGLEDERYELIYRAGDHNNIGTEIYKRVRNE